MQTGSGINVFLIVTDADHQHFGQVCLVEQDDALTWFRQATDMEMAAAFRDEALEPVTEAELKGAKEEEA